MQVVTVSNDKSVSVLFQIKYPLDCGKRTVIITTIILREIQPMTAGNHGRTKEDFLAEVRRQQDTISRVDQSGDPKLVTDIAVYSDFHGADYHYLRNSIGWEPEEKHNTKQEAVVVPSGFITDFASVPPVFWAILPPFGRYTQAAIAHDYMYWMQDEMKWSRSDADEVLKLFMLDLDVGRAVRNTIHTAVRAFGAGAWNSNASSKQAGERRILKKFPSDPLTTWKIWKQDLTNFV